MNIWGRIYIGVTLVLILLSIGVLFFRSEMGSVKHQSSIQPKKVSQHTVPDQLSQGGDAGASISSLATPTDLTIEHLESDGIILSWFSPDTDVDEFVILSAPYKNEAPTEFARVPGNRLFLEIEPVDLYDTRYFTVYASNIKGSSVESESVKHEGYTERNLKRDQWRWVDYRVGRAIVFIVIWSLLGFPIVRGGYGRKK